MSVLLDRDVPRKVSASFELGEQAYARHAERQPTGDAAFRALIPGSGAYELVEMVSAWLQGWDVAWTSDWRSKNAR